MESVARHVDQNFAKLGSNCGPDKGAGFSAIFINYIHGRGGREVPRRVCQFVRMFEPDNHLMDFDKI